MTIEVRYTELRKQIAAIILLPVISILIFVYCMIELKAYNLSETIMNVLIFGGVFIIIAACVLVILRGVIVSAIMDYDDKGIFIRIPSAYLLFRRERFIDYMDMKQFSMDTDTNGRVFMSLKCKVNHPPILLFPVDNDDAEDFQYAGDAINSIVAKHNARMPKQQSISQSGFYDGKVMKILALVLIAVAVLMTGLKIYDTEAVPVWRLIAIYVIGIPFLFKVFSNNSKDIE